MRFVHDYPGAAGVQMNRRQFLKGLVSVAAVAVAAPVLKLLPAAPLVDAMHPTCEGYLGQWQGFNFVEMERRVVTYYAGDLVQRNDDFYKCLK